MTVQCGNGGLATDGDERSSSENGKREWKGSPLRTGK